MIEAFDDLTNFAIDYIALIKEMEVGTGEQGGRGGRGGGGDEDMSSTV